MRLSHRPTTHRRVFRTERAQRDRGYVLVKFAFLLVPLLLMTGLSVDVGYWYSESSDMQKAADAAALAGVVWLPNVTKARAAAEAAARENGYPIGGNITMTVTPIEGANRRLKVVLRDSKVGSFFYKNLGGRTLDMKRTALAEYILPVPMGSPLNYFGGNAQSGTSPAANLWGNIHGPKTDNYKGDNYAAGCRGGDNCGANTNPDYRPEGYLYTLDVPSGVTGFDLQIWDAGLYHRGNETLDTGDNLYTGTGSTTTTWTMYNIDPTPLDIDDLQPVTSSWCTGGGPGVLELAQGQDEATYKNLWATLCKRTSIPAGRYYLRVQTSGSGSAANRYAIRVNATSTAKPRVSAYGDMSMYNNVAAGDATFYLAEVGPEHKGKILELQLYDPGEVSKTTSTTGDGEIQVIAPDGSIAGSCRTSSTNGKLAGVKSPCKFQSAIGGAAQYNGATVTLQIDVPTTYSCTLGSTTTTGCWWKIKYVISGQGNDTTTWSANILGDPVHLVEEEAA